MIRTILINNFKSIETAQTKLPQFGAIVGLNAAGKSNLIQSIEFIRLLTLGLDVEDVQPRMSSISTELFNLREKNTLKPFSLEITLDDESAGVFRYRLSVHLVRKANESSLAISEESLSREDINESANIFKRNTDGSIFKGKDENIPLTVGAETLFVGVYDDKDAEQFRKMFINTRVLNTDNASIRARLGLRLDRNGSDQISRLISRLMKNEEIYKEFLKIVRGLMPNLSDFKEISIEGDSDSKKDFLLLLQEKSLENELSTSLLSEGDLRTLYIIATALSLPKNAILIVEEIENGMHPDRVAKLIEHLNTISKVKNMQILFTTHSPNVINKLRPEDVIFVEKNNSGTHFTLLSEAEDLVRIQNVLKGGGKLSDYLAVRAQ